MFRNIFLFALLLGLLAGAVLAGGANPVSLGIAGLAALAFQVQMRRGWR